MQSFSFTPPQKWSKTVERISPSTGKLRFRATFVAAVPILTKGSLEIILNKK